MPNENKKPIPNYCDLKPPPLVEDPERFNRSGESQQPPLKRANISHPSTMVPTYGAGRDHRVAEKIMALCVLCGLERKRARGRKSLIYPQGKAWTVSLAEGLKG
jgi:hypothetical protein